MNLQVSPFTDRFNLWPIPPRGLFNECFLVAGPIVAIPFSPVAL